MQVAFTHTLQSHSHILQNSKSSLPHISTLFIAQIIHSIHYNTIHMTHIWPLSLRCSKTTSSSSDAGATTSSASAVMAVRGSGDVSRGGGNSGCDCCCLLTKLMRRLKSRRRSRSLRSASRQGSFQCRYDPLSYSLNFDDGTGGCGGSLLDDDYYKFYAFSSRFVVPNPRASSCSVVPVADGGSH